MKHIILLVLAFTSSHLWAQPQINSNVISSVGHTIKLLRSNGANSFNPGNMGANVTWNFNSMDTSLGTVTQKVVRADTTTYYSDFPSVVNYAAEATGLFGNAYAYAFLDNTKFEYYGTKTFGVAQIYTDPEKQLTFPFTFNNQFTDYFHDADSTYFGNVVVKADAYGTLILPTGSYPNALRINTKENYREYIDWDFNGDPIDSAMYEGQYYRWYLPNATDPLLEYSKLVKWMPYLGVRYDIDSAKHLVIGKNIVTSINEPEVSFESLVYPNPANNLLFFNAATDIAEVQLSDLCGKLLIKEFFNERNFSLNLEVLSPGTYCVQMIAGDNRRKSVKFLHF